MSSRINDELTLWMLARRVEGLGPAAIAERVGGVAQQYVSTATNRIRQADLAESGEDPDIVAGAYW